MDTYDRISELPDYIVHHILSFLDPYPDLVRTSVLSKKWFNLWSTFPVFNFDAIKIREVLHEIEHKKIGSCNCWWNCLWKLNKLSDENLTKYAAYILSKFSEHNVRAHTFKLRLFGEAAEDTSAVDKWIRLVVEKDVQVLKLNMQSIGYQAKAYLLPKELLSARSLTSLKLERCELPSSLMVDGVKFKSLKSLSLIQIPIDEHVIRYLTTVCPLIEAFSVKDCIGCKNFTVFGLQNLGTVKIHGAEIIHVNAPNLTYFSFSDMQIPHVPFPNINLASCKSLKTIHLETKTLKTAWFCEFISNFPLLENVHLDSTLEKKFEVSSTSLRMFELGYCSGMEEIKIDAPNLLSFCYHGDLPPPRLSMKTTSAKCEAYISCAVDDRGILSFHELKRFLKEANKFKVLDLRIYVDKDPVNVDELKATVTTPYELDQLELSIEPIEPLNSINPAILYAVFWCCHPSTLSCTLDSELMKFEEGSNFFKYIYEKLLHQEDQCQKEVQIVVEGRSKGEKGFTDLNSFLDALPFLEVGQKVLFKTERQRA